MKRIMLIALAVLILLPIASFATAKDKVLVVWVTSTSWSVSAAYPFYDIELTQEAAVRQMLSQRHLMHEEYFWGNKDTLKAKLTSGRYKIALIVGGRAQNCSYNTGSTPGDIKYFWGQDSSYDTTPTFVWYAAEAGKTAGGSTYINGAMSDASASDLVTWAKIDTTLVVANGSAVLDSFVWGGANANFYFYGAKQDTTINPTTSRIRVTPILVKKNPYAAPTNTYMYFWQVRFGTNIKYYMNGSPGTTIGLIDAIVCKYCTQAKQIQYSLVMDDWGDFTQTTNVRGTFYPWDHATNKYGAIFFTELGEYMDMIRSYGSKMTIGATMNYMRKTSIRDSTQWRSWKANYDTHIDPYYGTNFEVVWHDHGRNGLLADSISMLFPRIACYNDWYAGVGTSAARNRYTVYVTDLDSIYKAWQDTMSTYGFRTNNALMAPWDEVEGYTSTTRSATSMGTFPRGYLGDTILAFCKKHDMNLRVLRTNLAGTYKQRYGSKGKKNGVQLLFHTYMTYGDTTQLTIAQRQTGFECDYGSISGYRSSYFYDVLNQGRSSEFRNVVRKLWPDEFCGLTMPVILVHSCYLVQRGTGHRQQYLSTLCLLKHLAFFDELAGRKIYKPVFFDEMN